jgi:hypothetical protein
MQQLCFGQHQPILAEFFCGQMRPTGRTTSQKFSYLELT